MVEERQRRVEAAPPADFFDVEVFEEDRPEFDPTQIMDADEIAELIGDVRAAVQKDPRRRALFHPAAK